MKRYVAVVAAVLATVTGIAVLNGGSGTCTSTVGPGNIRTYVANAASGDTICLTAGSYTWSSGDVTKTSMTTVRRADGVSRSSVTISSLPLNGSRFVTIDGLRITGN